VKLNQNINDLMEKISTEICLFDNNLLINFPLSKYITYLYDSPQIGSYGYLSNKLKEYCNIILINSNEQIMELYHKLILLTLILKAKDKLVNKKLPYDINTLYEMNFKRIIHSIGNNSSGSFIYPQDNFLKDLAICTLKMIPAGAQKIHLDVISKRFLFKNGLKQFIECVIFIYFELGGFRPLYNMHTDAHDQDLLEEFNANGWKRFYLRVAHLLKMNKKVKGIFGNSWFFDPQLNNISPRLKYLREIPIKNGGRLFYTGSEPQSIKNAILKSATRRKLYNEGKYIPRNHLIIWSRKQLINWANQYNC